MPEIFLKTADNIKIGVNHYVNNHDDVVIVCPGWFMTKDSQSFRTISKDLSKNFDVLTMDFRGHGTSGGFFTFTAKEQFDLDAVVKYAKTECKYNKIYLMGFSLGAATSILYSAKHSIIDKLIAVSAPTDFYKIENKMYSPDAWIPTLFQKFEIKRWLTIRPDLIIRKKEKPIDFVDKINIPTLFIAGEKDPTVLPWHTENLYNAAQCQKDYKLFKKARHAEDIYTESPQEFIDICTNWFK